MFRSDISRNTPLLCTKGDSSWTAAQSESSERFRERLHLAGEQRRADQWSLRLPNSPLIGTLGLSSQITYGFCRQSTDFLTDLVYGWQDISDGSDGMHAKPGWAAIECHDKTVLIGLHAMPKQSHSCQHLDYSVSGWGSQELTSQRSTKSVSRQTRQTVSNECLVSYEIMGTWNYWSDSGKSEQNGSEESRTIFTYVEIHPSGNRTCLWIDMDRGNAHVRRWWLRERVDVGHHEGQRRASVRAAHHRHFVRLDTRKETETEVRGCQSECQSHRSVSRLVIGIRDNALLLLLSRVN